MKDLLEQFVRNREPGEGFFIEIEDLVETNDGIRVMINQIMDVIGKHGFGVVGIYEPREIVDDFNKCRQVFKKMTDTVTFGKHKGINFLELVTKYTGYVTWCLKTGVIRVTEELSMRLNKSVLPNE